MCVQTACREGGDASPSKPGVGGRDSDCCAPKGAGGCDVGYTHSLMTTAGWAKIIGGRPEGFFGDCDKVGGGNTCCSKGRWYFLLGVVVRHRN